MYSKLEIMTLGIRNSSEDLGLVIFEKLGLIEPLKYLVATVNDLVVVKVMFNDSTRNLTVKYKNY